MQGLFEWRKEAHRLHISPWLELGLGDTRPVFGLNWSAWSLPCHAPPTCSYNPLSSNKSFLVTTAILVTWPWVHQAASLQMLGNNTADEFSNGRIMLECASRLDRTPHFNVWCRQRQFYISFKLISIYKMHFYLHLNLVWVEWVFMWCIKVC